MTMRLGFTDATAAGFGSAFVSAFVAGFAPAVGRSKSGSRSSKGMR